MRITYGRSGAVLRMDLTDGDGETTCLACDAPVTIVNGAPMHDAGWRDDDHDADPAPTYRTHR